MKCDLHVHTHYSYDGSSSPKKIVEAAIKKGIDCLAITDHGETKGAREAMEYARGKPILIIPGIEIKSKGGDIIGLNIKEKIPNGLSVKKTIQKIKGLGGKVIIPHPFGWFRNFKLDFEEILDEIDAIEVLNAGIFGPGNQKALAFAKKFNLPQTGGSDAHYQGNVGKAYLEIPGKNLSIEDIFEQIKNKNVKICGEKFNFFANILERFQRGLAKILFLYVRRKKRKI